MNDTSSISTWLARLPNKRKHRSRSPSPSRSPSRTPHSITNSLPILLPGLPLATSQTKRKRSLADNPPNIPPKRVCNPRLLTRRALKELSHNVSRGPGRPKKVPAIDPKTLGKQSRCSSTNASRSVSESKSPDEIHWKQTASTGTVRQLLSGQGMWFCEEEAFTRHPEMKKRIDRTFQKERASRMTPASIRKIIKHVNQNATDPEDGYFRPLHDDVFKTAGGDPDWTQAGLESAIKSHFVKRLIPGWSPHEEKLGLNIPRPNHLYGIRAAQFPLRSEVPSDEVQAIISISEDERVLHAFFAVEERSSDGLFAEAVNQAIRDGAAMVNAKLSLKQHLANLEARVKGEVEDYQHPWGSDPDALAFSCCWGPEVADLYVHWYEKMEKANIFHIHRLGRYLVDRGDELVMFHHDVHNILDYGMLEHRQKMEGIVKRILDLERELEEKGEDRAEE